MDADGALNPKMLLPAFVTADLVENILLSVLAIDEDVPPNTLLFPAVVADVPPKTLLLAPVVADVPPKIPLPALVTVENVLLKKPLPEFVMADDVPLKLLFPELVTTAVAQSEGLLTVPITADVPPKILLPELVKADVLPNGTMATLLELVSWVLVSVASSEIADEVEAEVDGSPEDANLKRGEAVKEGAEASIEGLLVLLMLTLADVEVVARAELSLLVVKDQ